MLRHIRQIRRILSAGPFSALPAASGLPTEKSLSRTAAAVPYARGRGCLPVFELFQRAAPSAWKTCGCLPESNGCPLPALPQDGTDSPAAGVAGHEPPTPPQSRRNAPHGSPRAFRPPETDEKGARLFGRVAPFPPSSGFLSGPSRSVPSPAGPGLCGDGMPLPAGETPGREDGAAALPAGGFQVFRPTECFQMLRRTCSGSVRRRRPFNRKAPFPGGKGACIIPKKKSYASGSKSSGKSALV